MTKQASYLKQFFSKDTDDELVSILENAARLERVSVHFDGTLVFPFVTKAELERRCDDHLSLFFDL